MSLPSSWISRSCHPSCLLGPAFPLVVPRCLELPNRSALMRFPFLICMPLPPLSLLPTLLLPRLLTVMMKFPFHVSHTVLLWFFCYGDAEVPLPRPGVSCLSSSPPIVRPQPALQAGGRCPLGNGEFRFALSSRYKDIKVSNDLLFVPICYRIFDNINTGTLELGKKCFSSML
jgi:hypothetical protein